MVIRTDDDGLRTDEGVAGATGSLADGRRIDGGGLSGDFLGSSSGIDYGGVVTHVLPTVTRQVTISTDGGGMSES